MGKYTNRRVEIIRMIMLTLNSMAKQKHTTVERLFFLKDRLEFGKIREIFGSDTAMYAVQEYMRGIEKLAESKTIIVSSEQAEVFLNPQPAYSDSLEYILPFPTVFLQFTTPLSLTVGDPQVIKQPYELHGLILGQIRVTKEQYERVSKTRSDGHFMKVDFSTSQEVFVNTLFVVGRHPDVNEYGIVETNWQSTSKHQWLEKFGKFKEEVIFRNLAIACIGYINCENVYLEKEGEVEERINRKREREGKKMLEPYYVCRIRGVKYDSEGRETERDTSGRHVSFRFDVRGHFRRYESGKTTWVRPHQRGLDKELYIPKTYVVPDPSTKDKGE